MSILTIAPAHTGEPNGDSYNAGCFDGQLDALAKFPARQAMERASMADPYDPLWAQGYSDGYLHGIQLNAALMEKERTT